MLELVEGGRDLFVHVDVAGLPGLVPVEYQAVVLYTSPVDEYGAQLAEGLD